MKPVSEIRMKIGESEIKSKENEGVGDTEMVYRTVSELRMKVTKSEIKSKDDKGVGNTDIF